MSEVMKFAVFRRFHGDRKHDASDDIAKALPEPLPDGVPWYRF